MLNGKMSQAEAALRDHIASTLRAAPFAIYGLNPSPSAFEGLERLIFNRLWNGVSYGKLDTVLDFIQELAGL